MMAEYQIIVRDPFGTAVMAADAFTELTYARTVNAVGALALTLPDAWDAHRNLSTFDRLNRRDTIVEVWRSLDGRTALDMETIWLVRAATRSLAGDGQRVMTVRAWDALHLLARRHVLYPSGHAKAKCATYADDALKDVWTNNFGSGADAARDWSARITMQPKLALGPSVTKDFAWRNCLTVMQELAAASAAASAPKYLAFDLAWTGPGTLEFRTYTDWRGVDHRWPTGQNPVLLDPEQGNLADAAVTYDYSHEVTHATAGGQGQGAARTTKTASSAERIGMSPYGRIEKFVDARNSSSDNAIQAEADAALRQGMPRVAFTGKLVQTPGTLYGKHFGLGDIVTANYLNTSFAARLNSIVVRVAGGEETVEAALRSDELL